ncbi:hypothetical protein L7F22_009545 [Adiantum nelumboides]|nr:hypothetical protein [Adiantum nelumboides]
MLHFNMTDQLIPFNVGKGGQKKLLEELLRTSSTTEASTYGVKVANCDSEEGSWYGHVFWPQVMQSLEKGKLAHHVLSQARNNIRETTGWSDPVDSISVHAYIAKAPSRDVSVEEKCKREEDVPSTFKRVTRANTKRDEEPKKTPVPDIKMEEAPKDKKASKGKGPAFKLKSNLEMTSDLQKIFEEQILSSRVELTLGELLAIAKIEFHAMYNDLVKRRCQMTREVDPHKENLEVLQKVKAVIQNCSEEEDDRKDDHMVGANTIFKDVKAIWFNEEDEDHVPRSHYTREYWARATIETVFKVGDFEDPVVALVDTGSKINIMSRSLFERENWLINMDHGWRIKAANSLLGDLHGACPYVKVTIGDVCDEKHFFVQDHASYPLILGQPFIVVVRMETKVLDDGSAYAKICNKDSANDMLVNYLITRLQQAMANPALQDEVHQQLQDYGFLPTHQEERAPEKSLGETSKRGLSTVKEGENPYQELHNLLLDDAHQSRRRGHAQLEQCPVKEKERSKSPAESMEEDVAPRRHQAQVLLLSQRGRDHLVVLLTKIQEERKKSKKKKERKRSPSSPSSSS